MQDFPRLFIEPDAWVADEAGILSLEPAQARYLGTVLRREAGDHIVVFNAIQGEWLAEIVAVRRDKGTYRILEQRRVPQTTRKRVLVFALLKRDAGDLVIRMGTELGVTQFISVTTERTNVSRTNIDRWKAIAVEAAEQCERLDVPEIVEPVRLPDMLASWPAEQRLFAAIERAHSKDVALAGFGEAAEGDGLLIGPEGGFSGREIDMIRRLPVVRPVSLGDRILRADTAVAAGLALMGSLIDAVSR